MVLHAFKSSAITVVFRPNCYWVAFLCVVVNVNTPCINKSLVRLTLKCVPPECYRKVRNWLAIISSGSTSEFLPLALLEINSYYTSSRTQGRTCSGSCQTTDGALGCLCGRTGGSSCSTHLVRDLEAVASFTSFFSCVMLTLASLCTAARQPFF